MAIIRKGDKEAEAKLKERAKAQNSGKKKTNNTSNDPSRIKVSATDKGKSKARTFDLDFSKERAVEFKEYKKPVSGRAVADKRAEKKASTRLTPLVGSGVIEKGKLIKGGNSALKDSLDKKKK